MNKTKLSYKLEQLDNEYESYVTLNPIRNIFHHPHWINLICDCYGYKPHVFSLLNESRQIVAALPLINVNSWLTGNRWISLPFSDYCIPLADQESNLVDLSLALLDWSRENSIDNLEIRWRLPAIHGLYPHSDSVIHMLPLSSNVNEVIKRYHPMHLRNQKHASAKGVSIEMSNSLESIRKFYELHVQTRKRQGIPVQPWNFFYILWQELICKGLGFVASAFLGKECLAAAVFLHWNKTLTYKYGASSISGLPYRPNNLLFHSVITWGCANGYEILDLGKTNFDNQGLRDFKSRWGSDEKELVFTHFKPQTEKVGSRAFTTMQKIIQHSPEFVCQFAGHVLYKHYA